MKMPPIHYVAVYKANIEPPEARLFIINADEFQVALDPGPISFSYSAPIVERRPPIAGMTMGEQSINLPVDSYLAMQFVAREHDPNMTRRAGSLRVSEVTSMVDLCYPGLVAEKVFEGAINTPGSFVWLPEGPMSLTAAPVRDSKVVVSEIAAKMRTLASLPDERRERFSLATRWFRRGRETDNRIDRLFFWWTMLEIYPAEGTTNVVATTHRFLHDHAYPQLTLHELSAKLTLGRIYRVRGEVVHDGKAFVTSDEEQHFDDCLARLEATCLTCLRLLAGIEPGDNLDQYILQN